MENFEWHLQTKRGRKRGEKWVKISHDVWPPENSGKLHRGKKGSRGYESTDLCALCNFCNYKPAIFIVMAVMKMAATIFGLARAFYIN